MTSRRQVVAVIPARGGSKGIPRKNLADIAGRPLIEWSIDAAVASEVVDRVVVSTDDEEIAAVAAANGAEVPFLRPVELAADETPDLPVFQHIVDRLSGLEPDAVLVHLRPTSPVRPAGLIDAAVGLLLSTEDADSVRSVSPVEKSPYKMWVIGDGCLEPVVGSWDDEWFNKPRQSLPPVWQHDGVVDVVRADEVRVGSMTGRRVVPFFTPPGVAVDIDDDRDLREAGRVLARSQGSGLDTDPLDADPA